MQNQNNNEKNIIPEQLKANKDLRFAKITHFEMKNGKKKLLQEPGKRPYALSELQGWIDAGGHVGIWGWHGKLAIVDLDHPDSKERKQMIIELRNKCGKTWIVKSASGKKHLYYYVDKECHSVMKIDDSKDVAWEIRATSDQMTMVPINNHNLYESWFNHEIATTTISDIERALEKWTWKKKKKKIHTPAGISSASIIISFDEFLSHYGLNKAAFVCLQCRNISSEGKIKPALNINDDSVYCHRCDKNWNIWSMLEYKGCVEKKDQLKTIYQIAGEPWIELPPETGYDDQWTAADPSKLKEHMDVKKEKKKKKEAVCYIGDEIMQMEIPPRKYYLEIIPQGGIINVNGEPGVGKTLLLMSICSSLSYGLGFMDWENYTGAEYIDGGWQWEGNNSEQRNPINVAYIDGEMSIHDIIERIPDFNLGKVYINNRYFTPELSIDLTDTEWRKVWTDWLVSNEIQVVVFDNVSSLCPNLDENSKQDWDDINQWTLELRDKYNLTVIWVHHTRKDGKEQSGTTGRDRNVDGIWYVNYPVNYDRDEDGVKLVLSFRKIRQKVKNNKNTYKTVTLQLDQDGRWNHDSSGNGMIYFLYYLSKGFTYRDIADKMKEKGFTGYSIGRLNNKKKKLVDADWIDDDCNLTRKGRNWIEKYISPEDITAEFSSSSSSVSISGESR